MEHQQGGHKKYRTIPMVIKLHHLTQQTYGAGTCVAEGNMLSYMGIHFSVRRLGQRTVGKPEREDKITGND